MNTYRKKCCICLQYVKKLQPLSNTHADNVSYYKKLISCIPDMKVKVELKTLICEKCRCSLKITYDFWKRCMESKKELLSIPSQCKHSEEILFKHNINLNTISGDFDCNKTSIDSEIEFEILDFNNETSAENFIEYKNRRYEGIVEDNNCKVLLVSEKNNEIHIEELEKTGILDEKSQPTTLMKNEYVQTIKSCNCFKNSENQVINKSKDEKHDIERVNGEFYHLLLPKEVEVPRHKRKEKSLECKVCHKKFAFPSRLKEHEETHTNNRPFACKFCSKTYRRQSELNVHMVNHDYEKGITDFVFKCDICKKKFKSERILIRHRVVHSGERAYECSICGNRYMTSSYLSEHKKKHKSYKCYECKICKKQFELSKDLKKHKHAH